MTQNQPAEQSQKEMANMAKLNETRNKARHFERQQISNTNSDEPGQSASPDQKESVGFPLGMFLLATVFDLVGFIPVINFVSEPIAGLIFWFWQKQYSPKSNPLATLLSAKLLDLACAGLLPSNIGVVIYAYTAKKFDRSVGTIDIKQ